jgi:putative membrane protein
VTEAGTDPGAKAWRRAGAAIVVFLALIGAVFYFAPDNAYLWIKAMHVIAVISWMAGLLYLPRLFIYHHRSAPGSGTSETLKVMERRLFRVIMNPAMMISWGLGLYLAWDGFGFIGGWLHAKIAAVALMTVAHVYFGRALRAFGRDERPSSERGWRFLNEVPALLMIAIVLLVIVKPF